MSTPDLNTPEGVTLWYEQKALIEANLIARGYKLLTQRGVDEVCEKVVFVLNPELAVFTTERLKLTSLPRLILVKWGIVPSHNSLVFNTASPKYDEKIHGKNPFPGKKTNITLMGTPCRGLQIVGERYHEGNMSDRGMGTTDGTAYYKNTST